MIIDVYMPKGAKKTLSALIREVQEAIAKLTLQEATNWKEQHKFNKKQLEWNKKLLKIKNLKDPDEED